MYLHQQVARSVQSQQYERLETIQSLVEASLWREKEVVSVSKAFVYDLGR